MRPVTGNNDILCSSEDLNHSCLKYLSVATTLMLYANVLAIYTFNQLAYNSSNCFYLFPFDTSLSPDFQGYMCKRFYFEHFKLKLTYMTINPATFA